MRYRAVSFFTACRTGVYEIMKDGIVTLSHPVNQSDSGGLFEQAVFLCRSLTEILINKAVYGRPQQFA